MTVDSMEPSTWLAAVAGQRRFGRCQLTTLREKLVKIRAKVISSARYVVFQMAEVAVPRGLFRAILERIHRLWLPQAVPR